MLRLVRSTVSTWKRWSKRRPSPLSSDCFDLQTKPNYKSIQNICKTPVFHLCHQRIGGFPWVWGKSIEDQVVLLVRLKVIPGWYHEGVVHMKRNDTCIMIKKKRQHHTIVDIFPDTRSILVIFITDLQTRKTSWHFLRDMIDPCSELQQLFLCVCRAAALAFEVIIVKYKQN